MPEVEVVPLTTLLPDPHNANKGTERGYYMLTDSIRERGVARGTFAVRDADGNVIMQAGSKTLQASVDEGIADAILVHTRGDQLVVTVRDDLEAGSEAAVRLALEDNRVGQVSLDFDERVLQDLLDKAPGILAGLWNQAELDALLPPKEPAPDPGAQVDKADELQEKWKVAVGDVFEAGEQRLVCGDCTDPAVVARVMGGEKARLVLADPPYDFDTQGGGILGKSLKMEAIRNLGIDKFDPLSLERLAETSVFFANKSLIPHYIQLAQNWGASWDLAVSHKTWHAANWGGHLATDIEYILIIGKQSPISGQAPELYSKLFTGSKKDIDSDVGWAKPVALCEKFILLFVTTGGIVLDPFAGSGTTGIACARLGRKGRLIEIEPKYCAVTLERLAGLGLEPRRIGTMHE